MCRVASYPRDKLFMFALQDARHDDAAFAYEGLVIGNDKFGIVSVIHHDRMRLPLAVLREVGIDIDALQRRAVRKVEGGDRIEARIPMPEFAQIYQCEASQRACQQLLIFG